MRTKITETEATQATERKDQRRIFLISTALAVAVMALAVIGFAVAF
ncbi:hypothetical protein NHF40_02645 [Maricaulaceae bacterium EIL42A08]|nr:hypothetical protein [Maricaulaceae bacterium EIL42A08]